MNRITPLLLMGAALCFISPANADGSRSRQLALSGDTFAQHHEMSSRHRRVQVGAVVAPPGGFIVAPTPNKAWDDWRWPYVSWIGARDSLYVPGPLVTFVRYGSY